MSGIGKVHLIQVDAPIGLAISIDNFSASGTSDIVTTAISSALSTAGRGGQNLPFRVADEPNEIEGVVTSGLFAKLLVWNYTTGEKIKDAEGNEVYARLSEASSIYTLSYYSNLGGSETAFDIGTQAITFRFNYLAQQGKTPWWFSLAAGNTLYLADDPKLSITMIDEVVALSADNTFPAPALSQTPKSGSAVIMFINGQSLKQNVHFTVSGRNVTLNVVNLGYDVLNNGKFQVRFQYLV